MLAIGAVVVIGALGCCEVCLSVDMTRRKKEAKDSLKLTRAGLRSRRDRRA